MEGCPDCKAKDEQIAGFVRRLRSAEVELRWARKLVFSNRDARVKELERDDQDTPLGRLKAHQLKGIQDVNKKTSD